MIRFSPPTDIWHVGIVHAPIAQLATTPTSEWETLGITWLPVPKRSFCFIADPFGIWHEGTLVIFVEAYDYRTKRGHIRYYKYNAEFSLIEEGDALITPHHLSYPQIITLNGAIYMLPEAHKSGKLTLYRATHFPDRWEPYTELLSLPAIDATLAYHEGLWHCFYSLPSAPLSALYHATSPNLTSAFTPATTPLIERTHTARMGGSPFLCNDEIHLPIQHATHGYGSSLSIERLDLAQRPALSAKTTLTSGNWARPYSACSFDAGLHTLSSAGNVTLFDVKTVLHSPARHLINMQRRLRKYCKKSA